MDLAGKTDQSRPVRDRKLFALQVHNTHRTLLFKPASPALGPKGEAMYNGKPWEDYSNTNFNHYDNIFFSFTVDDFVALSNI